MSFMKKILAAVMSVCIFTSGWIAVNGYYDALSRADNDPTECVIEYEAENFTYSNGFTVEDDSEASGGKVLKSTVADAVAVMDIRFDKPVVDMVLYAEHKAVDAESNLSYIYFDNMDGEPMYTTN